MAVTARGLIGINDKVSLDEFNEKLNYTVANTIRNPNKIKVV